LNKKITQLFHMCIVFTFILSRKYKYQYIFKSLQRLFMRHIQKNLAPHAHWTSTRARTARYINEAHYKTAALPSEGKSFTHRHGDDASRGCELEWSRMVGRCLPPYYTYTTTVRYRWSKSKYTECRKRGCYIIVITSFRFKTKGESVSIF